MSVWAQVASPRSGCEIVLGLHVGCGVHHGPGAIATAGSVQRAIGLGDLGRIETKCGGYTLNQLPEEILTLWSSRSCLAGQSLLA